MLIVTALLAPLDSVVAADSSSDHALCDNTLSTVADLIVAGKLPPTDKTVLKFYDPMEDRAYGYFEKISKLNQKDRETWANQFFRNAKFKSRIPTPGKAGSADYVYTATIKRATGEEIHMDIYMITVGGRCIIEM